MLSAVLLSSVDAEATPSSTVLATVSKAAISRSTAIPRRERDDRAFAVRHFTSVRQCVQALREQLHFLRQRVTCILRRRLAFQSCRQRGIVAGDGQGQRPLTCRDVYQPGIVALLAYDIEGCADDGHDEQYECADHHHQLAHDRDIFHGKHTSSSSGLGCCDDWDHFATTK